MFQEADFAKWPKLPIGTSYLSHLYNNPGSNPDFTIHLAKSNRSLLTHKIILSAASGFFRGLFHSGMSDSSTDSYTFHQSDHTGHLDPVLADRAVEHVIQLLYYGNFGVIRGLEGLSDDIDDVADGGNDSNGDGASKSHVENDLELQKEIDLIVQMLGVANFFEMDHVTRACSAILAQVTNENNVLFHVMMPSNKQSSFLRQKCAQFLSEKRHVVFCQDTVSMLPYELLVGILLHLSSHRMSQEKVTEIFDHWRTSDPEVREPLRQQFMEDVKQKSVQDLSWYESKLLPLIEEPYSIFKYMKSVKKEFRVLSLGLDASGRTTMLYKLKLGEVVTTIPTIGFNVETVTLGNSVLTIWDVGGGDKIRPLWRHYYQNTTGVIVVIDSNDHDRLDEVKDFLRSYVLNSDELIGVPILFCANKQDLPNALSVAQLMDRLELNKIRDRPWFIQATSAVTGDGLYEGMDWLVSQMA